MKNIRSTFLAVTLLLATNSNAQTAGELLNQGLELKKAGSAKEALLKFKQAYAKDNTLIDALYERGWCESELNDYASALSTQRKVRNYWPSIAKVQFELGFAFQKLNQADSAIACYKKTLDLKPDYMGAFKQLGNLYYDKENYPEALAQYTKYVSNPDKPVKDYLIWYRKGFCENSGKEYTQAKISLNQSLLYKTDYTNTYLELGFACSKLKENDEAIRWFNKAVELDPRNHVPYNGIGEVYRDNIKDKDMAMTWYQKSLDIKPGERKASFGMGYCLNSKQRFADAIPYLKTAIQNEPTYTAAYTELGFSYYKTGNKDLAIENLKKSISLNARQANPYYYLTLVYIDMKDKKNAQKMVDALRDINPGYATELQQKVNELN